MHPTRIRDTIMKTKLFTLLFLLLTNKGIIFADAIGDFYYKLNSSTKTAVVYGYHRGSAKDEIIIPSTVDYTYYNSTLQKNVTEVYIVTGIEGGVFDDVTYISSINVPSTVTSIGSTAFLNVPNVIYSGSASGSPWGAKCVNGVTEGWLVFSDESKTQLMACSSSATGEVSIPNSVVNIAKEAFYSCRGISSLIIGTNVETIGYEAFEDCSNVTSVTIHSNALLNCGRSLPDDVFEHSPITEYILGEEITSIGNDAFSGGSQITSINIPNNVTSIGDKAFSWCTKLESINIPTSVQSIGEAAFEYCKLLSDIEIPNANIGAEAFQSCDSLKFVVIGDGTIEIGYEAFEYCRNLKSVIIGDGVTDIGGYAFQSCDSLSTLILGNSVTHIRENAFEYCNLSSVKFPASIERVDGYAFGDLESATFYNSTNYVEDDSFGYIDTLNICMTDSTRSYRNLLGYLTDNYRFRNAPNINVIQGSTRIEKGVFDGNKVVERVTVAAGVDTIPKRAFANCTNLREVIIGTSQIAEGSSSPKKMPKKECCCDADGVCYCDVDDKAFNECVNLKSIVFLDKVRSIGNSVAAGIKSLESITLNEGLNTIGQAAFAGCGLTSVTIPSSVTSIGYLAFENNPHLINVDMKCSTLACQEQGGAYGQFANCPNIETVKIKMEKDMSPNERTPKLAGITGVFGSGSIGNWKTLEFYEGSTLADVGDGENTSDMPNLETLRLANSIIEITNYSFAGVSKLRKVTLPSSLKVIGCGVFTKSGLKKISISEGVQEIPGEFCMGSEELEKVTFGSQISNIRFCAFQNCKKLKQIHTNRITPPEIDDYTFCYSDGVNKKDITVHVPKKAVDNYVYDSNNPSWSDFYICSGNDIQSVTLPSNTPQTEVQKTAASVSVPSIPSATYGTFTVTNKKDNSTRETEFTGWGSGFDFAPRRGLSHVNEESTGVQGLKFTMRELAPNTTYDYSIALYDIDENLLEEFTGAFTTGEEENPGEAIEQINQQSSNNQKLIKNGQILILRGDKTYTIDGRVVY